MTRESVRTGLSTLGDVGLLHTHPVGLFCSARCPGTLIIQAYDLARQLRDAEVSVMSGFHSPIEKECLDLLLRGSQPIIVCLARCLSGARLPSAWHPAIAAGRLLAVSDFADHERRVTAATAARRNQLVCDLSSALLVIHAGANSATLSLCEGAIEQGKKVFALDNPYNEPLSQLGATMISPAEVAQLQGGRA